MSYGGDILLIRVSEPPIESIPIGSDIVELDSESLLSYLYHETHTADTLQINFHFIFDGFSTGVYFDSWKNITVPDGILNVTNTLCLLEFANGLIVDFNGYQENVNPELEEMVMSFDAPEGTPDRELKFLNVAFIFDTVFSEDVFYSLGTLTLLCEDGES